MTDTDIDGLVKRLNWLAASLEADAKSKGIGQGSEGARCSVSAADALQSMQREVAELEKERDRLILAIADHHLPRILRQPHLRDHDRDPLASLHPPRRRR